MHKTFSLALIFCSCVCSAQTLSTRPATIDPGAVDPTVAAQPDHTEVNLPDAIGKKFSKDVASRHNVTWEMKKDLYWITYADPGTQLKHVIVYDKNGKIMRQEDEVKRGNYPDAINKYMSSEHKTTNFKVWSTENPKGKKIYFVPLGNDYIWFSTEGSLIDEKKSPGR
jgi:hypothetical protein